jgi:V/A-type H+-transporting ATPase subunit K
MKRALALSLVLALLGLVTTAMCIIGIATAEGQAGGEQTTAGLSRIGSGIAIGFAACGAGIGLGTVSAAAIGVIAEKPELFGRTMIYVVFVEAVAIYGLVIALLLWMAA